MIENEPLVDPIFEERHATNLELFLDLVFVFAVTQFATLIREHGNASSVFHGVLIAFLVWWQWSQFTWAGAAMDLQRHPLSRVLVLLAVPFTLIMTISIPQAFHGTGIWFGSAYFGVQIMVLGMQAALTVTRPQQRDAFIRYASLALVCPVLVFAGAFFHGDTRVWIWGISAIFNILGAFRGAGGDWSINPTHFAERHALFLIIALGEVVVAIGATAYRLSDKGLSATVVGAVIVAALVACLLWWSYFAYVPTIAEKALMEAAPIERGELARDFFTFGHFPLVMGVVFYSVVAEHVVETPQHALPTFYRVLLFASVASFVGGLTILRLRLTKRWSFERIATIAIVAVLVVLGAKLDAVYLVGATAAVLGVAQFVRYGLFKQEQARQTTRVAETTS